MTCCRGGTPIGLVSCCCHDRRARLRDDEPRSISLVPDVGMDLLIQTQTDGERYIVTDRTIDRDKRVRRPETGSIPK